MTTTLFGAADHQPRASTVRLSSMARTHRLVTAIGVVLLAAATACTSTGGTSLTSAPKPRLSVVIPAVPVVARKPHRRPTRVIGDKRGRVVDVAWTARRSGWLLEGVPCAPGGSASCARLLHTSDGGRRWRRVAMPLHRLGPLGERIAFSSARAGYVYGPKTWATVDGGKRWVRTAGTRAGGRHTAALALDATAAYRIAYRHTGCPGPCSPVVEWQVIGAARWRIVDANPPGPDAGMQISAAGEEIVAAFEGNLAGGADEQAGYAISTDGGAHWRRRVDPCGGHGRTEFDTVGIAARGPDQIDTLCQSHVHHASFVAVSTDGGTLFAREPHDGLTYPVGPGTFGTRSIVIAALTHLSRHDQRYEVARSTTFGASWHAVFHDRFGAGLYGADELAISVAPDGGTAFVDGPRRLWISPGPGLGWHRASIPVAR